MATVAAKGLSKTEMKLLNDFSNTVSAREFTENVTVTKLNLLYDEINGFSIELEEKPNDVVEPPTEA